MSHRGWNNIFDTVYINWLLSALLCSVWLSAESITVFHSLCILCLMHVICRFTDDLDHTVIHSTTGMLHIWWLSLLYFCFFSSCVSTLIVRCKCSEKLEQSPDVQLSASVQSHHSLRLPGKQLVPRLLRFLDFSCLQSAYQSRHSVEMALLLIVEHHVVWCSNNRAVIRLVVFL